MTVGLVNSQFFTCASSELVINIEFLAADFEK